MLYPLLLNALFKNLGLAWCTSW